jgi:hypothetical protein
MNEHETITNYFYDIDDKLQSVINDVTLEVETAKDNFLTDCREYFEDYLSDTELMSPICTLDITNYLEYNHIDLTIGFHYDSETDTVSSHSYQTGDNSFTGSAYGHPHWIVLSILPHTIPSDYYSDIITQFDSLTNY